jgi:hypothetical protein
VGYIKSDGRRTDAPHLRTTEEVHGSLSGGIDPKPNKGDTCKVRLARFCSGKVDLLGRNGSLLT